MKGSNHTKLPTAYSHIRGAKFSSGRTSSHPPPLGLGGIYLDQTGLPRLTEKPNYPEYQAYPEYPESEGTQIESRPPVEAISVHVRGANRQQEHPEAPYLSKGAPKEAELEPTPRDLEDQTATVVSEIEEASSEAKDEGTVKENTAENEVQGSDAEENMQENDVMGGGEQATVGTEGESAKEEVKKDVKKEMKKTVKEGIYDYDINDVVIYKAWKDNSILRYNFTKFEWTQIPVNSKGIIC